MKKPFFFFRKELKKNKKKTHTCMKTVAAKEDHKDNLHRLLKLASSLFLSLKTHRKNTTSSHTERERERERERGCSGHHCNK
jgi:hypothetical protein